MHSHCQNVAGMLDGHVFTYLRAYSALFALCFQAVAGMHRRKVAWCDAAFHNVQCTGANCHTDPGVVVFDYGYNAILQEDEASFS